MNGDAPAMVTARERMRMAKVNQLVAALRIDPTGHTLPCFTAAIREYRRLEAEG
jgi:hypothetical protein